MTKKQREEVESILCTVFDGFTDERLKGRYYSMAKMSEEEKKDLVKYKIKKNKTQNFLKTNSFLL